MFNRQPYNKGKFNTSALTNRIVYLQGSASCSLEAAGGVIAERALEGSADATMLAGGNINFVLTLRGSADAELFSDGKFNAVNGFEGYADIRVYAGGNIARPRELGEVYDTAAYGGFNRQPFNRRGFNVTGYRNYKSCNAKINLKVAGNMSAYSVLKGNADLSLLSSGKLNATLAFEGNADTKLLADGTMGVIKKLQGDACLSLEANSALFIRQRYFSGKMLFVVAVASSAGFNTYRYEYIELPDLTLKSGDELIINTDEMTVTLNGQNVVQYLSRDSEFFLFNPHENEVIYTSGNPNDKVDIKILWKDAYL